MFRHLAIAVVVSLLQVVSARPPLSENCLAAGGKFENDRIDHTTIRVLFSPDDDPDDFLLKQLVSATSSLDAMVFTFGSNSPLLSGVVNRFYAVKYQNGAATSERKVAVRVGLESVQARWWSVCPVLKDLGVPVKLEKSVAKLHHKVGIIDKKTVILGSYNWTLAANDRNDESTLVMSNEQIADVFVKAFDELWDNVLASPQ